MLQELALNILLMFREVISTPGTGCAEEAASTLGLHVLMHSILRKKKGSCLDFMY